MAKSKELITAEELFELAHSALNDVDHGDGKDPYVRKIRRIARKALRRIEQGATKTKPKKQTVAETDWEWRDRNDRTRQW